MVALLAANARLMHLRRSARWLSRGRQLRAEIATTMVEVDECIRKKQIPTKSQLLGSDVFDNLVYYWRTDRKLRKAINTKRREDGAPLLGG